MRHSLFRCRDAGQAHNAATVFGRNPTPPPTALPAGGARIVLNPQRPIFWRCCELGQLALRRQYQVALTAFAASMLDDILSQVILG